MDNVNTKHPGVDPAATSGDPEAQPATVTIRPPVVAAELSSAERLVEVTEAAEPEVPTTDEVFPQSVASGGPTPNGCIVWTRIDPEQFDPSHALRLEVAPDESFERDVSRLELEAPGVKPSDNYTVRIDLEGLLEPDRFYYYRFGYAGTESRTGRCRTLPEPDASPERLRAGLLNCQNYQNGYFGAMAHLAAADVDYVLHLGDYIYEEVADGYPNGPDGPYTDRRIDLPDGETLPMSLADFRHLYETYKRDRHLQRLHERHTVIQTWDDHAIANDRYWDYDLDAPVFPHHPCERAAEFTRYLTRAGIQAWWEFVPGRITYDPTAERIHDSFELYRAGRFGDLVTVVLTDERLFRSEPLPFREKLPVPRLDRRDDRDRTMLGEKQREWFLRELRESETTWTVWANAVLFKSLTLGRQWLNPWSDSWDGFEAERAAIARAMAEARRDNGTTMVTLTGDMHTTLATVVRGGPPEREPVSVEFMTPGVTSVNFSEKAAEFVAKRFGNESLRRLTSRYAPSLMSALLTRLNPDYGFLDSAHWGYSIIEFTREDCTWDVHWVDKTVDSAEAASTHQYRIRVPAGTCEFHDLSDEVTDAATVPVEDVGHSPSPEPPV